ncbi:hypothetical protein [Agromyces bauzanensis]|uniref:Uncharacterized protein n=1 Tax=Agromyces bauzanensis TaxID=1308924 RepID=A0A917PGD5_9MICO|nr:hypothetical protein [Agromyces bauzanensis]GGJ76746.1 hypothetical protein GCM10011372_13760 [Agromyces bauzanensis]
MGDDDKPPPPHPPTRPDVEKVFKRLTENDRGPQPRGDDASDD